MRAGLATAVTALLTCLLAFLAIGAPAQAGPDAAPPAEEPRPVIMLGFAGLTFEDVHPDRTPHLWRMVAEGAVGTMTPRSVRETSCIADGWLGVASGSRAADEIRPTCRVLADPIGGWVPDWDVYRAQANEDNYTAGAGVLSQTAAEAGLKVRGIGPGAAIGTADSTGRVESWEPLAPQGERGIQAVSAIQSAHIVLMDLGSVYEPGNSVADLDASVGEILAAVDEEEETAPALLAASLADGRTDGSRMQFAAAYSGVDSRGRSAGAADAELLTSSSTRQPGLVQVSDLTPTLLSMVGVTGTSNFAGAPFLYGDGPAAAGDKHQLMLDRQTAVLTQESTSAWMYGVWGAVLLAALAACTVVARRRGLRRAAPFLTAGGLLFAALPVSTYLVNLLPWERATSPDVAMLSGVLGWAAVLTVLSYAGPWNRLRAGKAAFIAAVTVGVLAADVLTGSHLQMSTMLGEPLLIASRFYGIGNSALALYCTALLVFLGVVCSWLMSSQRRYARVATTAVVVVTVVVSCVVLGTPGLGTKFGSVPTLVIGTAVFALTAAGIRLSWKRLLLFGGGAAALMLTVLFVDWLRPPGDRTHFGRFFDSLLSGEAGAVLLRKIGMNIDILTQSWMTVLLPLLVALVLWAAISPARFRIPGLPELYRELPLLRTAVISLAVLLAVGTFINDSGIVVPAVGMLFLVPILAFCAGSADSVRKAGRAETERARTKS